MKEIPKAFLSTLIAQRKLLGNGNSGSSGNNSLSNNYNFNPNIKELPTFTTPIIEERVELGLPLTEIVATFARKARSVYEKTIISSRGQELLAKANEYEIPYNVSDIDFLALHDQVEEFEEVIDQANRYGIDWKNFGYDLIAIEQEIAEEQEVEHSYENYARIQFFTTRGVEA